ncbi:MAG: LPS assembly lipoprotein LptE [Pseudomonadota bacterium]
MLLWARSIGILSFMCVVLSACGFEPMYGSTTTNAYGQASTENKLSQVAIDNIPNAEGQYLRNQLIDRFYRNGRPANTNYRLLVSPLTETETNLDVTIESENTRAQLRIDTQIQLMDGNGDIVLTRNIRAFNSFNVLGSQFTTIVSERDAREAALNDIARQIETQLVLYFGQK